MNDDAHPMIYVLTAICCVILAEVYRMQGQNPMLVSVCIFASGSNTYFAISGAYRRWRHARR